MDDRDDDNLLERLQRGDEAAITALIVRHDDALRRLARRLVSTGASADEVVQDTWLAVLAGLPSFAGRSSLKTWIFRILMNRARTRFVREARLVPVSALGTAEDTSAPDAATGEDIHDDRETPRQALQRKQLAGALEAAMAALPERQRRVIMLRDALGWSTEDVCSELALNETNQRVLLHRARARLRVELESHRAAS